MEESPPEDFHPPLFGLVPSAECCIEFQRPVRRADQRLRQLLRPDDERFLIVLEERTGIGSCCLLQHGIVREDAAGQIIAVRHPLRSDRRKSDREPDKIPLAFEDQEVRFLFPLPDDLPDLPHCERVRGRIAERESVVDILPLVCPDGPAETAVRDQQGCERPLPLAAVFRSIIFQ